MHLVRIITSGTDFFPQYRGWIFKLITTCAISVIRVDALKRCGVVQSIFRFSFVEFGKENIAPCKDIQRVHQIHTNNTAFIIPYYHVVDNFGSMSVSDTCIIRIFYPLDLAGLQGLNFFRRGIYAVNLQNDFPAVGWWNRIQHRIDVQAGKHHCIQQLHSVGRMADLQFCREHNPLVNLVYCGRSRNHHFPK